VAACRVVLCCQECPVMDVRSVFRGVILLATQHNTTCCHKTNWNGEINMTLNSVTLARTI